MKTLRIWQNIILILATISFITCSNVDDDKISEADIQRALFEMKKDYTGELKYGLKDKNWHKTIEGVVAQFSSGIRLSIPLEPIAEQVKDKIIAQKLLEWQNADVYIKYEFISLEDDYYSFRSIAEMSPDERFAEPITRTSPIEYGGLTLLFNQGYLGEYQKYNESLSFNICIGGILINRKYMEDFKPIIYRYEGRGHTWILPDEQLLKQLP